MLNIFLPRLGRFPLQGRPFFYPSQLSLFSGPFPIWVSGLTCRQKIIRDSKITNIPTYELERQQGGIVCGVDEVGRGPWAGPVMAAAVILDPDNIPDGLNDSKKLTGKKRETLYPLIVKAAHIGIGTATVEEIDQHNILQATLFAMQRAVADLPVRADHALIDGNRLPKLICPASTVIKGDNISLSIAAASIIAKVERDFLMDKLSRIYPEYGWDRNAGYGTRQHSEALSLVGPSRFHRKSFAPIAKLISQGITIRV